MTINPLALWMNEHSADKGDNNYRWLPFATVSASENQEENDDSVSSPLDSFLVGPENRLAELAVHWIIEGVPFSSKAKIFQDEKESAEEVKKHPRKKIMEPPSAPGEEYPPLHYVLPMEIPYFTPFVFFGQTGCGKTHLVKGIIQAFKELYSNASVHYQIASDFHRDFLDAYQKEEETFFHFQMNSKTLFVIDNLDLLENHWETQEEIIQLLDDPFNRKTIFIFTMGKNPLETPGLLPGLVARLEGGVQIPVYLPSNESRKLLLQKMAADGKIKLQDDVLTLLLNRFPQSVSAMHGAFDQMIFECRNTKGPITVDFVENYMDHRQPQKNWTLEELAARTAKHFSIRLSDLRGKSRSKTVVRARNTVIYLARKLTDTTFMELGRWLSGRKHTTVLHSYYETEAIIASDPQLQEACMDIITLPGETPDKLASLFK